MRKVSGPYDYGHWAQDRHGIHDPPRTPCIDYLMYLITDMIKKVEVEEIWVLANQNMAKASYLAQT